MDQNISLLVERAKAGDQQAVAALYEKTSRKAYYLSLQLVKDQDQAQDILQDAYLKVFTSLNMLQQPENFQGWLDTIVINKSKDYLRKKKPVLFSQLPAEGETDSDPDFEDESGYFSPEKQVDYGETKRLVKEIIDRFPEQQRMAVVLYYLENMSVGRIAQVMECSEGTVKSRLNYGRKSIKTQVLALEKKGTKLYCMPLAPFLYWMFRQQVLGAVVPGAVGNAVLATAAGTAGAAVGSGTGSGTAGAAVGSKAGARTAGAAPSSQAGISQAAGSTFGTGTAAAAGKSGIVILGKAVSVKAVAVAAAVCLAAGGACAVGVHFAGKNNPAEAVQNVEDQEREAIQEVQPESESAPVTEVEAPANAYGLTAEDLKVLENIYRAGEGGRTEEVAKSAQPEFVRLYQIVTDHFHDQDILFDGKNLTDTVEGPGMILKASSVQMGDIVLYTVAGHIGSFRSGVPDGNLISFKLTYYDNYMFPNNSADVSKAGYIQGKADGVVVTERWRSNGAVVMADGTVMGNGPSDRNQLVWSKAHDVEARYDQTGEIAPYLGWVDIKMDAALYASYFQAVSPEDSAELPHELEFHYSIENQQNAAENEENLVFDHDFQKARVLDSSKRYEAQTVYLGVLVNSAVLWDGQPSQHDEGTKALPEACSTNAGNNGPVMAAGTLEMKNGKNPASSLYIDGQGIDLGMCTMEELEVFLGKFGFHPIVDENGASMELEIEGDPQPGSEYGVVYSNQGKGITFTDGGGTPVFQVMPRNRSGRAVTVRQCTVYRFKASSAQAVQNCGHTVRVFNDMVDLVNTEKRMIADLYDRYGIEWTQSGSGGYYFDTVNAYGKQMVVGINDFIITEFDEAFIVIDPVLGF